MSQPWKQFVDATMQAGEMTRTQAQRLVKQLVREGQVAEDRAKAYVDELVNRSRKRTEDLRKLIRREIQGQLSSLGVATKDDLAKLEKKLSSKRSTTTRKRSAGTSKSTSRKKTSGTKRASRSSSG